MIELSDGNVNLLIGPDQQASFTRTLDSLTSREGVACVLLIDTAGKIIAGAGGLGRLEVATVAALAAGDFATTRALARRIGEKEFSLVFQRERELNVYLQAVTDEAILVVVFDQAQGLGAIRVLVRQVLSELRDTLGECPRAVVGPDALESAVGSEAGTGVSASAETPRTPASGVHPSRLLSNPPPDLIRKFWRIKTLAEDSIRAGVPVSAPDGWRQARDLIVRVASTIAAGEAAETRQLLGEIERILMNAYERLIAEQAAEGEEWRAVGVWHGIVDSSTGPFSEAFGERAEAFLENVDRDSMDRHPDVLGRAKAGHMPEGGLAPLRGWPRDRRRQAVDRAFLDLSLNRLWVIDKLFGRSAGDGLIESWRAGLSGRPEGAIPSALKPALGYLFAQAARRGSAPGRRAPGAAPGPADREGEEP